MNNPTVKVDKDGIPEEVTPDHVWELNPEIVPEAVDPGREELRDFFAMVGGFGSRARRSYERIVPAPLRSRTALVVASLAASISILAIKSWGQRPPTELPIELQGAWTTTAPTYADRGFWIGKHRIAFRVGPAPEDVHVYTVSRLHVVKQHADSTWYDIEYTVPGGTSHWPFMHANLPQPAIVFAFQHVVWRVKPDGNSPVK